MTKKLREIQQRQEKTSRENNFKQITQMKLGDVQKQENKM